MTVIEERLSILDPLQLAKGSHLAPNGEMAACVMEAVAYVAGEPWSDHPECACPVLTAFCVSWNDSLDDETRQRLKPYIPRLVGTRSTAEVESARSWLACDWLVRTFTPAWLDLAGLTGDAAALRALPELTATDLVDAAMPVIEQAKKSSDAAWDAAWDAARDAAWDAAWAAARAAAGAAAGVAAWVAARAAAGAAARAAAGAAAGVAAWVAARAAARDAAWDAARAAARAAAGAAAWDAARAAARAALHPTVVMLQDSAFELLDRLIETS